MADDSSITQLLEAFRKGDDAAAAGIYAYFQARARAVVRSRLGPPLRDRVGLSDVVQEGMRSALSAVRKEQVGSRREEFEAFLVTILRRKTATAARKASARPELSLDEPAVAAAGRAPDEEAMHREEEALDQDRLRQIFEVLFQEPATIASKHRGVKGLVRVLGIIDGLSAPEVRALLQELFPDREPPKERTIQLTIESGWEDLRRHFGSGSDSTV
jgi:DNA-directed RNA polymerase specialized sigma24 family protein